MRHEANHSYQITLTRVLERHMQKYLAETGTKVVRFAADVRAHYEATFPAEMRDVEFSSNADAHTRMKRDAEKVSGWFGDTRSERFPVEALESFIAAFPAERRFALQTELSARQELMAVPMLKGGVGVGGMEFGDMMREISEGIAAVGQMYATNNGIGPEDRETAPNAIAQLQEAQAKIAAMVDLIQREALGGTVAPVISLDIRRA